MLKDKHDNVDVIYGNALNVYIPPCDKIISALPYSITEPFIEKLLRCEFKECTLIVGKKYADAVINKSLTKLALLTNSFFNVTKIMDIEPEAFDPAPRVMSSMIKLVPIKKEDLKYSFKRFIFREMFFHRDKKLKNNLMEALIEFSKMHDQKLTKKESKQIIGDGPDKNKYEQIIEEYEIPKETLNKLMENLSNEEYELVYNKLK